MSLTDKRLWQEVAEWMTEELTDPEALMQAVEDAQDSTTEADLSRRILDLEEHIKAHDAKCQRAVDMALESDDPEFQARFKASAAKLSAEGETLNRDLRELRRELAQVQVQNVNPERIERAASLMAQAVEKMTPIDWTDVFKAIDLRIVITRSLDGNLPLTPRAHPTHYYFDHGLAPILAS